MTRTSPLSIILCFLASSAALAQDPITDVGFAPVTSNPDVDLVVVRERSYGAGGVDLTAYGIGTAPVDFVQSIYLRLNKEGGNGSTGFRAKVTFPVGVEILGVITDEADLGGSADDGLLTGTDDVFGLGPAQADNYSAPSRGLESGDHYCLVSTNVLYVQPTITNDVDDLRIIIDYGTSFPVDLTFDIESADASVPSVESLSVGMQIGDGGVPGSGDGGEARGQIGIPLTAAVASTEGTGFLLDPVDTVYLARDNGAATLDAFDTTQGFVVPGIMRVSTPANGSAFTNGPSGYLYPIGFATGAGYFDVVNSDSVSRPLSDDLPGQTMGATGDGGSTNLWLTRDRSNGNSHIDRVRASNMNIQQSFAIDDALLPTPVGIVNASDGMLYVLGQTGELIQFDPQNETITTVWSSGQADYTEIARNGAGSMLFLLRDNGVNSTVDFFDVASSMGTIGTASFGEVRPMAIAMGPDAMLHVVGDGFAGQNLTHWILDPASGAAVSETACTNLEGSFFGVASFSPPGVGTSYCGPAIANSSGRSAFLRANGSGVAGESLHLSAWALPRDQFGFFLVAQGNGVLFPVPQSQGRLCLLGGDIGRYNSASQIQNTGTIGRFFLDIDTGALPMNPETAAMAGETWNFQAWYRDDNPMTTSNFTDATALTFQ
ncbi:MAG: hypothetical protein GY711_22345 [bacterium]|nr:hypothetical protein [bacterium]